VDWAGAASDAQEAHSSRETKAKMGLAGVQDPHCGCSLKINLLSIELDRVFPSFVTLEDC
jgi:hypothetical protein